MYIKQLNPFKKYPPRLGFLKSGQLDGLDA